MRRYQFELIQLIRNYFVQQGFLDVLTPPAVENPGMEVHIHPFEIHSAKDKRSRGLYLHTSPEFCMKELLASPEGYQDIFTISYCFRDEPPSPIHRPQFLMLEWYRKEARYETIMDDVEGLIRHCLAEGARKGLPIRQALVGQKLVKKTMQEIFQELLGVNILDHLDVPSMKLLLRRFPQVPLPEVELPWDDYFFLLFLNEVEPRLKEWPLLLIYEFPAPLAALSTLKPEDPRICERFEVYIQGIELCNCFNELSDPRELRRRFEAQSREKEALYSYSLPEPKRFHAVMGNGYPASAGVALGVERLLNAFFEVEQPFFD